MGAFFGSILIRTGDTNRVRAALEQVARQTDAKFLMGPEVNGWISVFPDQSQSGEAAVEMAKLLPDAMFQFMIHDDDIFAYWFYRNGALVDHYNSCPDYFEGAGGALASEEEKQQCQGRPELFQDLLSGPDTLSKLKELLGAEKEDYPFENDRMAKFVELLGLSNALSSYDYLQEGETDDIEGWEQFVHIEYVQGALADDDKIIELNPHLASQANRVSAEKAAEERRHEAAEQWNKFGTIKRAEGDLDAAMRAFDMAIGQDPEFAEAYNNRGRVKKAKGDLAGAMADFNKAIELKPGFADAYTNRGLVKKAKNDVAGALADYGRAIELKPDSAVAHNNRGDMRRLAGDFDGALADLDKAIQLQPGMAAAYSNRGSARKDKGDGAGALADYNKAIELDSRHASAWNNRGELKRTLGDLSGAMADYDQAISLRPDGASSYNNRAMVKKMQGDLEGALTDYDKAIHLNPRMAQFYGNRADARRAKGMLEEALLDYNKALELNPKWVDAINNRGEARRAKGDLDGAMADYNRAIELKPTSAEAHNNRALVRKKMGDLDGALIDHDKAIELKPKSAQAHSNRAETKQAKGDVEGAIADFEKALELKPDFERARGLLEKLKLTQASRTAGGATNRTAALKSIAEIENSLALRTDFSSETAWQAVCAAIMDPNNEFETNVDFVSDPQYTGLKAEQLASVLPKELTLPFAFIIDDATISNPEHPILAVDLQDEPGRTFRVIPSKAWMVENNLSVGNMGFAEFADAVDTDGIFRGH